MNGLDITLLVDINLLTYAPAQTGVRKRVNIVQPK